MRAVPALIALAATAAIAGPALAGIVVVGKKIEIGVDPTKMAEERSTLWGRFGGWCAIADWHPAVEKCTEETKGDDTFRTLTLKGGGTVLERRIDTSATGYKYEILESPFPVQNYQAQFSLTPDDDDEDEINFSWSATFDPKDKTAKEARDVISGIFKDGLEAIEKAVAEKK